MIVLAFDYNNLCSNNINGDAFCYNNFDDDCSKVARDHPSFSLTPSRSSKICTVCKLLYCWDEHQFDVELGGILPGNSTAHHIHPALLILLRTSNSNLHYHSQIAKLSMIPVSCLLEVSFDKIRYSRDTKLSIVVVLLGVAVCTVTDVSVNTKGFIAAFVAVWSTALQQYVSCLGNLLTYAILESLI